MKQFYLTEDIKKELSNDALLGLYSWAFTKKYFGIKDKHISIGQMIEFLDEHERIQMRGEKLIAGEIVSVNVRMLEYPPGKLCDDLWQAVKEVLESEKKTTRRNSGKGAK